MKVNWLFKNVTVIDGSGGPQFRGDVAVKGDRIVDMAPALNLPAEQVIDGQGRVLAPGFIDVHTHDDINVIRMPAYLPKLSQGVTTVIVGNCGISAATATLRDGVPDPMNLLGEQEHFVYPTVNAYAQAVEAAKPSLNVGTLIGHTALRNNHMDDLFRPATETEIAGMRVQLRDALRQGALGLSSGLAYASAFQSTTEEVMALAEELAAEGEFIPPTCVRSSNRFWMRSTRRSALAATVTYRWWYRTISAPARKTGAAPERRWPSSMRCASARRSPATATPILPARRRWI